MTASAEAAPGITACIVCRNEADRIGPCLESVQWVDEILVMDLESGDASPEIARALGARVMTHPAVPVVESVRNVVAAAAAHDWILVLDPDERVTPGLAAELREVAGRGEVDAVVVPRTNFDFGHPPGDPLHRYEAQTRMYRRSRVTWPRIPNALPEVPEERLHRIAHDDRLVLIHDRSRNVPEVLERVVRYAPAQAQSMIDRGEVFTARGMVGTLGRQAYKQFFQGRALQDGVPGLVRASLLVAFHFYVWAAFWHLSGARRTAEDDRYLGRIDRVLEAFRRIGRPLKRLSRRLRGR